MAKRLIRTDEFGLYVRTGGYTFRPQAVAAREFFPVDHLHAIAAAGALPTGVVDATTESQLEVGKHADAVHRGGTTTAQVGAEIWVSSSIDPRYTEHISITKGA